MGALTLGPALTQSAAWASSHATAATTAPDADWPGYLYSLGHSSYNPNATSITPANLSNLEPVWQWLPPASPNEGSTAILASPTVVDGVVYIGLKDGYFYAISEATHKALWSQFLGLDLPTGTCGSGAGAAQGIISTATVTTDPSTGQLTVYVFGPTGVFYALNAATGAIVWQSQVDTPSTTVNDYYSWGSPAVFDDNIYIGVSADCDNPLVPAGLVAIDQTTGAIESFWHSLPPGQIGASIWSSPAVLPDGSVIATTGNGPPDSGQPVYDESIVHLSAQTLQLLDYWQVPPSQQVPDGDFGASPTLFTATIDGVSTPMVGACNKNGYYYAFAQDDLNAGPVWQDQITEPYPGGAEECDAGAIWDGTNLIEGGGAPSSSAEPNYTGSIQSLDPATGAVLWKTHLDGTVVGSPSEDAAGVVAAPIYQSSDGNYGVYLVDAASGAIIGFIPTDSPLFSQPVFADNDLIVTGAQGVGVTAFEITQPGAPITQVSPSTVFNGHSLTVTLTGTGFSGTPLVYISGGLVVVKNEKVVNSTTLTFTATVQPHAVDDARDITVSEPGTPYTVDTCTACLTIAPPPVPPVPTSADPDTIAAGTVDGPVTLTGTGFASGAVVTSHSGIRVKATYVSATQLDLSVTVAAAEALGAYNLIVQNPAGGIGVCDGCLTVTAASSGT